MRYFTFCVTSMYPSDIEINPGLGWANILLGDTLSDVRAALATNGHQYEFAEDGFTIEISAPETSFYFDDSEPKRLVQIVFYDKDHRVDGQPIIGLPLAEAMLPFEVKSYADTLWSLVSIDEEYQNGKPLADSKRVRQSKSKTNLECATLWVKSRSVGLVMLYDRVHAIAIREIGMEPKVGCGQLDSTTMSRAAEPRPLPPIQSSATNIRSRTSRGRSKAIQAILALLAVVFVVLPAVVVYRDIKAWSHAKSVVGVVTDTIPDGPFPDEVVIAYSVPDSGEHHVKMKTSYTTAREVGDEVELEYLPDQPQRAMTRILVRDEGLSVSPWYLFGSIALAMFCLVAAFPNHIRLNSRRQ
jgi:hypothetical protein